MSKAKVIKSIVFAGMLMAFLWMIVPSQTLLKPKGDLSAPVSLSTNPAIDQEPAEDENFHKYPKPVYFGIFKFIVNFIPGGNKPHSSF